MNRALLALALSAACNPPCDKVGEVCTIAGTGVSGFNGADLQATASWLFYPTTVAVDPDGRLVINDYNNYLVRVVDDEGRLQTILGMGLHAYAVEGPALETPIENVVDVEFTEDGTMYVAEQHSGRIHRVVDGELAFVAGNGDIGYGGDGGPALDATFDYTSGVEVAPDGRIFIADTNNHVIREVGLDGNVRLLAGAPGDDAYADGALADSRFDEPQRMHLDGDVLYVADSGNAAIRAIDLVAGIVSTVAGTGEEGYTGDGGPATEAELDTPWGVYVDADGLMWVSDSNNHVIRTIDGGTIDTFAGTGNRGGLLDGEDPLLSTFDFPADVTIGSDGNLYVADMINSAIRKVVLVEPE